MTRFCDQCGAELKPKAMFCSKCGAKSDLPPEINVENKSGEEQVNNMVNENVKNEHVEEHVNNTINDNARQNDNVNETVNNTTNNRVNNTNTKNTNVNFDFNDIDLNVVLKYSAVGTVVSLILGLIFFALFINTSSTPPDYGLTPYSFITAVILAVVILTAQIKDKINAIVVGGITGLLTGILQFTTISIFFRIPEIGLSLIFGNPILVLIVVGIVFGYVGNVYLKDKINFPVINQYLGE